MRKQVFTRAWELKRAKNITLGLALTIAWGEWRSTALVMRLKAGRTSFSFVKKDGTVRNAIGTTDLGLIPSDFHPKGYGSSDKVITFFDLEKTSWRSVSKTSRISL